MKMNLMLIVVKVKEKSMDFSLTFHYYEHKVHFHQYSIHFNHAQINVRIYRVYDS